MKRTAFMLAGLLPGFVCAAPGPWSLISPNRDCELSVSLSQKGELSYRVLLEGKPVIDHSPLGLRRDDQNFESGLVLEAAGKTESRREAYELFAGMSPRVDHLLNRRSLVFRNIHNGHLTLDLAASDEGVAFRYRFTEWAPEMHIIQSERTGFRLSPAARGWLQPYHAAGRYTPAYEDFYFHVAPGDPPPQSRAKPVGWSFPALFYVPAAGAWALVTESGTDAAYCACHLAANSDGGLYQVAFPGADEATRGQTNHIGPEPRSALPWTTPWRVVVLAKSAAGIALASLVTDLAAPSRVADTSWIRPGRASWAWWSHPDGPADEQLFNRFTDFGASMGWEYTLFDAGWWVPGLPAIAAHAKSKGVAPLAWCSAGDFYEPAKRKRKFDELEAQGVRGVKVDFWCSDRQEAMAAMQAVFEEAAARRLVVNLHGCTVPRGWQRTWPNLLSLEAVLGTESYFYEPRYTQKAAELNTVLPFTRNAVGPMDITPVACSPKKYPRSTTAAHELAAALVFTSGLIHYADSPEFFDSLPVAARDILRDAPARWDETRCLLGEPGRFVVFARRAGLTWFLAGLNGTSARLPVTLDLSPFAKFRHRLLIEEGVAPAMQVAAVPLSSTDRFTHDLSPCGGFILRMDK